MFTRFLDASVLKATLRKINDKHRQHILDFLNAAPRFAKLTDEERMDLASISTIQEFNTGECDDIMT